MMAKIKSNDTKPEMLVRKILHGKGFRYRMHDKSLLGKPDIVLPKYKTIIFIHGCFWHRHSDCVLAYMPKSNVEVWQKKFNDNVKRDLKVRNVLTNAGWKILVVWECRLRKDALSYLNEIALQIKYDLQLQN
jgi:DNA mismatch endonuclease (patch repair protein)